MSRSELARSCRAARTWWELARGRTIDRAVAVLALATIVCGASRIVAAPQEPPGPSLPGRHFILLLDDSADSPLRPGGERDPARIVVQALFDPINGEPGFSPGRDVLSVVFFQTPSMLRVGCFLSRPPMSLSPEGMFETANPGEAALSSAGLADYLRSEFAKTWQNHGCRFAPGWSPIARSQRLVLPYVSRPDAPLSRFVSKIYLIQASNKTANPLGDVTGEVDTDAPQFKDRQRSAAIQQEVDRNFTFGLVDTRGPVDDLYVDRFSVAPNLTGDNSPDKGFVVPRSIDLRRTAVGADRVRLEANGSIHLSPTGHLVPIQLILTTGASDEPRRPWNVGEGDVASERVIDLQSCATPCRIVGRERIVDVLQSILLRREIPSASPPVKGARIRARARFLQVIPGVYDRLLVDSSPQSVELQQEKAVVIEPSLLHPQPLVIDNPTLGAQWQPSDVNGLDQQTAAARIVAARSWRDKWKILFLVVLVVLFLCLLFLVVTHRRFDPEIELKWGDDPVDFNASVPDRLQRTRIEIRNSDTAWLTAFQRNPRGRWMLMLNHDLVVTWPGSGRERATGIDCSSLLRLVSRNEAAHPEKVGPLQGDGEHVAFMVLDGVELAKIEPPKGWDGHSALLRLEGTLVLECGGTDRSLPYRHDLKLVPERDVRPEAVLDGIATSVKWTSGEDFHLGAFTLHSRAQHAFGTPAQLRCVVQLKCDAGLIYREAWGVSIGATTSTDILITVPHGKAPNPTHLEEVWTLEILLDDQQPIVHPITVHKDVSAVEAHVTIGYGAGTVEPVELSWDSGGVNARQGERLAVTDGLEVRPGTPSDAAPVSRSMAVLELCTIGFRLGKPDLGGQFDARVEATLGIPGGNDIPLILQVDGETIADAGPTAVVTQAAPTATIILGITHQHVFDALQERTCTSAVSELRIEISVRMSAGEGREIVHKATVLIGQGFSRTEEGTILSLDFGNAAIAVATLSENTSDASVIDLQQKPIHHRRTLGQEDPGNPERSSPLLPSAFAIEFDRRTNADGGRPGTHWAPAPTEFDGSDPCAISLPALSTHYSDYPERVVQSIKHVIASDCTRMELAEPIVFDGHKISGFDVDKVLAGVMKAVALTYVGTDSFERLVFTVPNVFGEWQEQRVRSAVQAAFASRPEWTNSLSESDAVMHGYLPRLPRDGRDRMILFFDFGSGTIDLTLAKIRVPDEKTRASDSIAVTILARIGVDRAGAYLDQVLTSIVDQKIKEAVKKDPEAYRFHLIDRSAKVSAGVANFAAELGRAKRNWEVDQPLRILQDDEVRSIVAPAGRRYLEEAGIAGKVDRDGVPLPCIEIEWKTIHDDKRIQRFFTFVMNRLVSECLRLSDGDRPVPSSIVVSGRGALWPGFVEEFGQELRKTLGSSIAVDRVTDDGDPLSHDDDASMKLAVVRGAASWLRDRDHVVIKKEAPAPTHLALIDLDKAHGSWRRVQTLGLTPIEIPAGRLTLARIDFRYDANTLSEMLKHPIGRRLIRELPFHHPVRPGQKVTASVTEANGRYKVNIYIDGYSSVVELSTKVWQVGDWSMWNTSLLGEVQ